MNINTLTNLLFELASRNINKVSPAVKTEGVAHARDAMALGKKMLETIDTSLQERRPAQVETKQQFEQPVTPPAFTPLPLRSELFPAARFYTRLDEDKTGAASAAREPANEIFIYLATANLSNIWVRISSKKDFLSVKCFTDNGETSKILRENFPLITLDLKEIGFTEVCLTSQTRAELRGIVEELLPKFEAYLLNRKI
ncbi:MAG: hypothetical protein A4E55_01051 [Pelotomaculum sp. PtaU1.Bin035]|nr:MAG: hypothetical protein A4E55_01051 [Pelotomaculum sp. PtaU1.Bin035]